MEKPREDVTKHCVRRDEYLCRGYYIADIAQFSRILPPTPGQSIYNDRPLNFSSSKIMENHGTTEPTTVLNFVTEVPAQQPQGNQSRQKRRNGTAIAMAANVTKQPRKKEEEGEKQEKVAQVDDIPPRSKVFNLM